MQEEITNRVATSKLVTFDLEELYQPGRRISIDIKDLLHQGLMLKEKDLRDYVKAHDWTQYQDCYVAVMCSADAIIPTWSYMLIASSLQPYARMIAFGSLDDLEKNIFQEALNKIDWSVFKDAKVVVKGCSKVSVPVSAYVEATAHLRGVAATVMYGEPCSTVPIYKRAK